MNRTTALKIGYSLIVVALIVGALIIYDAFGKDFRLLFAATIIFLIASRIPGFFFRELLIGRRLMKAKEYNKAIFWFSAFLDTLATRPWIAYLIWMSPSLYTTSVRAIALNNIGACSLELGALDDAESKFKLALEEDSLYPIPHFNLAILWEVRDQHETSMQHYYRAKLLGYTGNILDQSIDRVKLAYASYEPLAKDDR